MTDLRTLLDSAAGPATAPSASTLDDDVTRGHSALRRHRTRTRGARAILVAAAVGLVAVGGTAALGGADGSAPVAQVGVEGERAGTQLDLVAYTAGQPTGFSLAQIPEGWTVRSDDASTFLITPPGSSYEAAGETGVTSVVGGVYVSLTDAAPVEFTDAELQVGGAPAVLVDMDGGTRTLYVALSDTAVLAVQVWAGIDLDQQQILDLAGGITVTDQAVVTNG